MLQKCEQLKVVVYFDDRDPDASQKLPEELENTDLKIVSYEQLKNDGMKSGWYLKI